MTRSTRKGIVWTLLMIALAVAVIGGGWALFATHELTFTRAEVQDRINAKLPHTNQRGDVTVNRADVVFDQGRIGLSFDATGRKFGREASLEASTLGTVRYDNQSGAFYFEPHEVHIERVATNGRPVGERTMRLLDRLSRTPKMQERRDNLVENAQAFVDAAAQSAVSKFLERVPVYTLPDTLKGQAVRMSLQKVTVNNDSVTVTLCFAQVTVMFVGFVILGIAALFIVAALALSPEGGIALLLLGAF